MSAENRRDDKQTSISESLGSSQKSGNGPSTFLESWSKVSFKQWTLPWKHSQIPASPLPIPIFLQKFLSLSKGADGTERSLRDGVTYMTGLAQGDEMKLKCQDVVRQFITEKLPAREATQDLAAVSRTDPALNDRFLYGRSCKEFTGDQNTLPSPEDVFEALLCVPGGGLKNQEHPNKLSSMVYAFAVLVSLCIERPDEERSELNQTSPFLDLSPLYGLTTEQTESIRRGDGSGKLIRDRFCEDRTSLIPPATIVLLILWNRNHNYIADQLLSIGHWNGVPSDEPSSQLKRQDEEIFDLARKINCKVFRSMVLEDFLKGLLGLPVIGSGLGNSDFFKSSNPQSRNHRSTIEFGLLHNYSALASEADRECLHNALCESSGSNGNGIVEAPGLRKGKHGYSNHSLLTILRDATDRVAGTPGAGGIAPCMKSYQTKIIQRAREWNVCSLNEFRRSLGLEPFTDFKQWNSKEEVYKAAEKLYKNIENLELYPGLQAEKSNSDSGFALGSTMRYGLLVDIIASLINDPSPNSLSEDEEIASWITRECSPQSDNGAFGAMLPTLLLRHFPKAFSSPNVYALFPFSIPSSTRKTLERLQVETRSSYNFDSVLLANTQYISSFDIMKTNFSQPARFTSPYGAQLEILTGGYGFLLGFDDEKLHDADLNLILLSLFPNKESIYQYCRLFRNTIEDKLSGTKATQIDIVHDVINATCMQWVSETMCTPLSRNGHKEMYNLLSTMHGFLFRTHQPENGWAAQRDALIAFDAMSVHIKKQLRRVSLPSDRGILSFIRRIATELWGKRRVGLPSPSGFLRRMIELSEREGLETVFKDWTSLRDRFSSVMRKEFPDLIDSTFDEDSEKLVPRIRKQAWDLMLTEKIVRERIRLEFKELVDKKYPLLPAANGDPDELSEAEFRELVTGKQERRDNQASWAFGLCAKRDLRKSSRRHLLAQRIMFENRVREMRLVANIVGLCIMSVTLAQACSQSVMFHLLSQTRTNADSSTKKPLFEDKEAIKQIISKSFEFRSPLSIHRIAQDKMDLADGTQIQKGDHLYADVRKVGRPEGVGFHKCPAFAFVNEVMPETLQTIFRLEELGLHNSDRVKRLHNVTDTDSKQVSVLHSLVVTFKSFVPRVVWESPPPLSASLKALRERLNMASTFLIILLVVFAVIHIFLGKITLPSLQLSSDRSPVNLNCTGRTEVFEPYHDVVIRRGRDGKPIPVEILYKSRKPYRVSVIDVDKRDLRLNLWVDSQNKGLTRDFVLNKSMDCGENLSSCLKLGYSAGVIVVPPGKHTVKFEWAGKEYIPGTQDMDWGGNYSRRFKLQREYCL